jgi:broad specificity phosphatase PhoE
MPKPETHADATQPARERDDPVTSARTRRLLRALALAVCLPAFAAPSLAGAPLSVFVVRHADKPNDEDDALSVLGAARARALAERLLRERITEYVASEKRRTQLTAQPLWEASLQLGRAVKRCAANEPARIVRAIERSRARAILVVTHSDEIDDVVAQLSGVKPAEPCACEYDRLYRIDFPSGFVAGRGALHLETFGALPTGPSGEACSAAAPIDPLTCKSHPRSTRAERGAVSGDWPRCVR